MAWVDVLQEMVASEEQSDPLGQHITAGVAVLFSCLQVVWLDVQQK
jgi:hypothetical protein